MNAADASVVDSFAELARGFCNWCETSEPTIEPASQAASWLCKLYAAALLLPQVGPENSDGLPELPSDEFERAKSNLGSFNGLYYREFSNPDPLKNGETVMGDVGDDLLDTYRDIRSGLLLFENGQKLEALWFWAFLHHIHWGRHAVGALFALHCLSIAKEE